MDLGLGRMLAFGDLGCRVWTHLKMACLLWYNQALICNRTFPGIEQHDELLRLYFLEPQAPAWIRVFAVAVWKSSDAGIKGLELRDEG